MKRTRPLLYALCALLILPGCASETDEERKARLIEEDGTKVMTFVIGIHDDPDAKTMNEVYDACVAEGDTCTKNE